jgi:hypothetical protein
MKFYRNSDGKPVEAARLGAGWVVTDENHRNLLALGNEEFHRNFSFLEPEPGIERERNAAERELDEFIREGARQLAEAKRVKAHLRGKRGSQLSRVRQYYRHPPRRAE